MKKFYLSQNDSVIGGVCGGLSSHLGMDSTVVRLIFILLIFTPFPIFILYLIAWMIAPNEVIEK